MCSATEHPDKVSLVTLAPDLIVADQYTSGDIWSRNTLTGNWGGERKALADKGIFVNLGLTQVGQGLTGGLVAKSAYTGSADLWLNLDTARLGWWPGGLVTLHTEGLWGNGGNPIGLNSSSGAVSPANFDATMPKIDSKSIALSEAYLTQALSENFVLLLGQIDGASLMDRNKFAGNERSQFLNGGLKNNLMLGLYAPYTAATLAGVFNLSDSTSIAVGVLSPGGEATDWFENFFKDLTIASELEVRIKPAELPGTLRFDFLWTSEPKLNTNNTRVIIRNLIRGVRLPQSGSNWMINFNFDQYLYVDSDAVGTDLHLDGLRGPQGIGIFGRFGYGGSSGNLINLFGSFGIGGRGLIPNRPNDRYGIGWYFMDFPTNFKRLAGLRSENGIEAFYNFALTPWAQLTGDVQWVNPAQKNVSDPWVLGGRLQIYF